MSLFIDNAWAQAAGGAEPNLLTSMLPLVLIFVVFYFLLIRPQSKRAKEHKAMVETLAKGDEVVTAGGILGKITEVSDQFVALEVSSGVVLKIQKHTVGAVMPKGTVKSA